MLITFDLLIWSLLTVAAGGAPSRCVERPTSTSIRATNTTLNVTTSRPVNTEMSTVPREGNTVPRRSRKAHTERSSMSVHLWTATSKTKQARVTCGYPVSKTVEPRTCDDKCLVHVEVERRGTRRNTRRGWGGEGHTSRECGVQRTLGDEKRSARGWVHIAGVKTRTRQRAARGS